jgi:tetratricopeptide (TPR) repeat protein
MESREGHFDTVKILQSNQDDKLTLQLSPYDEFDEVKQLVGEFGDKTTSTYESPKHAGKVLSSKSVQKPLRRQLPIARYLSFLLFVGGCVGTAAYLVQQREYELQRQLSSIREQAPIAPPQLPEAGLRIPAAIQHAVEQAVADPIAVAEPGWAEKPLEQAAASSEVAVLADSTTSESKPQGDITREANKTAQPDKSSAVDTAETGETSNLSITHSNRQNEADRYVRAAYAAYQTGGLNRAGQLYDSALQLDHSHRDALLGRAAIYLRLDRGHLASEIYRRLLIRNSRDHAALAGLNSMAHQGNLKRYAADLHFLLTETPDSVPLNYALGNLLSRQKRWSEAQQHFFTALAGDPDHPDIVYNLAVSLDNLGKSEPAVNFYRSALELARIQASSFDKERVFQRLQVLE